MKSKRLALLVAQPAEVDPRVTWTASLASREFDVTVVALRLPGYAQPARENPLYRTVRVPREPGFGALAAFALALLVELPPWCRLLAVVLLLPPALAAGVHRVLRLLYRNARRVRVFRFLVERLRRRRVRRSPSRAAVLLATAVGHFAPVLRAYAEEIAAFDPPPDVVHCCDLDTLLVGVQAKRRFGCQVIYDAHEFWPESDPEAAPWESRLLAALERVLIHRADHVVTVNPLLAGHFERVYSVPKVLSVPNAAPVVPEDTNSGDTQSFDPPQTEGRIKVLYQGGFAPERGIEELLDAWKRLAPRNACLILRGPDNEFKTNCVRIAEDLGLLGKDVFFPPPVDTAELIAAARSADIGVIPYRPVLLNHRYCCPNKLSQYMHAGLMIVCSDVEYVREVVSSAQCGVTYDSSRQGDLVAALRLAIEDNALRQRSGRNALEYARSSFNWETASAPLAAVFRSIARQPAVERRRDAAPHGPRTVLVLYYTRGVYPLRNTIRAHLYCWKRYSQHRTVYINVAFGFPARLVRRLDIDAVVFDTTFLSMRWTPSIFHRFAQKCRTLVPVDCVKIAMPQDEFLHTRILGDFIREFGITHLLTCADRADWPTIYPGISPDTVSIRTILTGYIDTDTIARIAMKLARKTRRDIDIGYRAWRAEYWLGAHATHKVRVAEEVRAAAESAGLTTDISLREQDVLNGDAWFDFLLRCRATVGVEGGATVLDAEGEIKQRVDAYLRDHPGATFEQTRDACFPGEDGKIALMCISPRHLEACATRTCQFLIEGRYNGILQPWRHYIPLASDYSDVHARLALLGDAARIEQIADRAYDEIACNEALTYRAFVRDIDDSIISAAAGRSSRHRTWVRMLTRYRINAMDRVNWAFIRFERWVLGSPEGFRRRIARRAYACMIKRQGEF